MKSFNLNIFSYKKESNKPLYSFEHNSDYVYDVQWSPINPAVFACADGTGRLDLWNLINDTEVPSASIVIDGTPALNKIRWSASGHQIAIGDDQSRISLFDLNESFVNPRPDDWSKLCKVLKDLKENSMQSEEANSSNLSNISNNSLQNLPSTPANFLQQPGSGITGSLPTIKSEPIFDHRYTTTPVTTTSLGNQTNGQIKISPK
jgi:WD40 repeat protein